ncbi:MAG: hypothetical protein ABI599_13830 [Flavobacteriales bacterium]
MGYTTIQSWLNEKAVSLRASGYQVEFQHTPDSLRIRVEGRGFIGEVLLWDTLHSDVIVGLLEDGSFLYESYGKVIDPLLFRKDYEAFLAYFPE